MPIRASRWNKGSLKGGPRPSGTRAALESDEILEGRDNETVRFFGADGEPQAMRQPVGADCAQDQAPVQEKAVRRLCLRLAVEMQKQEIADARRDLDPERGNFMGEPGKPGFVMGDRFLIWPSSSKRRDTGRDGAAIGVERPANAVDRIAHFKRRIAPAKPDPGKTVDLREGARHHDVFADS